MNSKSWFLYDKEGVKYWFNKIETTKNPKEHKVIIEFRKLIMSDPIVRLYMTRMIEDIPKDKKPRVKDVNHLLEQLNKVLTVAPDYNETLLVGTPFSAILLWTMGSKSGFAAYRNEKINNMFKKLLKVYSKFLSSRKSLYVFNKGPNGWMSAPAMKKLKMENYEYKPNEKYWGFNSWNDFFTRKLAKGVRPITEPDNDKVVVSGCDSTIYKIAKDVKLYSKFWIKSQPYSLIDMLGGDVKFAKIFEGGIVYQAFLNPFNYHRWHSPISGTIVKAYVKEGLYFSQIEAYGENETDQDHSESYITSVQTRSLIIIKAKNKKLGYVCMMPVGMVEISSCIIDKKIKKGYEVKKGEELGYFQFGGSTHCLIFEKNKIKEIKRTKGFVKMGEEIMETI